MPRAKRRETKEFMQGNAVIAHAARAAGATSFYGYPITPSTEVFETWVQLCGNPHKPALSPVTKERLSYLQCEDEMASGFALIGACLAGKKAFTATAGPGNILMQDAFSAAEALRIPTVAVIMQRGGLSTSTVIYSQEEVTLTCFGGNGEGFRVVYSPSSLQDLYTYTLKSFNTAWKYRYPTFLLGDGYLGKMSGEVTRYPMLKREYVTPEPILLGPARQKSLSTNLRNCYDQEEEINSIIEQYRSDYARDSKAIAESESYRTRDAHTILIAHGIVASAAKVAVDMLRSTSARVGLWRPITLRPLDVPSLVSAVGNARRIIYIESALGQMSRLINDALIAYSETGKSFDLPAVRSLYAPALGITPTEIVEQVLKKS
ncbi:MAG: ferredoxin oxidoreductase [Candidatus Dojkabacteria bacterium]|nr:ferredoxin oxidoreductase [Candidatus Dojkabacteria bacterium]